jgi:hypothetical protein
MLLLPKTAGALTPAIPETAPLKLFTPNFQWRRAPKPLLPRREPIGESYRKCWPGCCDDTPR